MKSNRLYIKTVFKFTDVQFAKIADVSVNKITVFTLSFINHDHGSDILFYNVYKAATFQNKQFYSILTTDTIWLYH